MNLSIRLFARARELALTNQIEIEVSPLASIHDLRSAIIARYPQLETIVLCSAIAVNHDFVDDAFMASEGQEIALIPPVSGG